MTRYSTKPGVVLVTDVIARLNTVLEARYEVERRLAAGGMATVYVARDLKHDRPVAVKVLKPELAESVGSERFLREIKVTANLQHPHILPLLDSGECDGLLYYVTPLVTGGSLRDRLEQEAPLPVDTAVRIAEQVGAALSYAHSCGVIHRDIKPGNILLTGDTAVVSDFGIAHAIAQASDGELTGPGVALGTPTYMSPEQAFGSDELDERTDQYALGCVLYEMLAGDPPHTGPNAQAILRRKSSEPPGALRLVRDTVPETLERVVMKALGTYPADRFPTMHGFTDSLQSGEISAISFPVRRPRRAGKTVGVAAVVAIVGLGIGIGFWLLNGGSQPLDSNTVVIFPLEDHSADGQESGEGENVATIVGFALGGTEPLKWLDGWDWLTGEERVDPVLIDAGKKVEIARSQLARYYIDGRVVRHLDSVTVILRLHDAEDETMVARGGASGHETVGRLGLLALYELLPSLVDAVTAFDVQSLTERNPAAVLNWLQGEAAYRRGQFGGALDHFSRAVADDSAFAVAALRGAQAGSWIDEYADAEALVDVAINGASRLPERFVHFAHGLRSYIDHDGDSALSGFVRSLEVEPSLPEAWLGVAEVVRYQQPRQMIVSQLGALALEAGAEAPWSRFWLQVRESMDSDALWVAPYDSVAGGAAAIAFSLDSTLTLAIRHLAEAAVRSGDGEEGLELIALLEQSEMDTVKVQALRIMAECVSGGPASVDWSHHGESHVLSLVSVGAELAGNVAQPACARAAFTAILESPAAVVGETFAAVMGLQSLLVALEDWDGIRALLASEEGRSVFGQHLYLLDAGGGAPLQSEAAAVADGEFGDPTARSSVSLWIYAQWLLHESRVGDADTVLSVLRSRGAESEGESLEATLLESLNARLLCIEGDTTGAIDIYRSLREASEFGARSWSPWTAFGAERVALSQLLIERGELREAFAVAAELDDPEPMSYLIYLGESLRIRAEIARRLGHGDLARSIEARRDAMRGN